MKQVMMGRRRSLRSRRQLAAKPEALKVFPADYNRTVSPTEIPLAPKDHLYNRPQPRDTPDIPSDHSQLTNQTVNVDSYTSPIGSQPPEMMIGLALGSPGQSPLPPLPPEESISWVNKDVESKNHVAPPSEDREGVFEKTSRWKKFGGFFGKTPGLSRASSSPSTHHRPGLIRPHENYDQYYTKPISVQSGPRESSILHAPSGPPRDPIGAGSLPPLSARVRNTLRKDPSLRKNYYGSKQLKDMKDPASEGIDPSKGHTACSSKPPIIGNKATGVHRAEAKGSLLQVEIPNIELDRYSVMFSSLLQPCQQSISNRQPSPKGEPSFLARRQADMQELNTGPAPSNFERPWLHRELSTGPRSGSPDNPPAFSLFPPSPTALGRNYQHPPRERSPLHRSATNPGDISPSRAKFDFTHVIDETDPVIVIVHTPPSEQPLVKPRQPSGNSSVPSDTESFTTARESSAPDTYISRPGNDSPRRRHWTADQVPSTDEDHSLREAAEISIARQISMSQRQRQLLVQAVPKVALQRIVPETGMRGNVERKSHHSQHSVLEEV
ncbi:MAG: hypothetical protein Q9223_001163 [Gallowayella weberi]